MYENRMTELLGQAGGMEEVIRPSLPVRDVQINPFLNRVPQRTGSWSEGRVVGDVPRYAPVVLAGHLLQVVGWHPDIDAAPGGVLAGKPGDASSPPSVLVSLPRDQEDMPAGPADTDDRLEKCRDVTDQVRRRANATVQVSIWPAKNPAYSPTRPPLSLRSPQLARSGWSPSAM
jgi:hypothetical protein